MSVNDSNYENDFFAWTQDQAKYLKNGELEKLDIINLQDEIEDMGKSEKRALESQINNILMHMLKAQYQKERDCISWQSSIKEAKVMANKILKQNPSLKYKLKEIFIHSYEIARIKASGQTGLEENIFPESCPWTIEEVLI